MSNVEMQHDPEAEFVAAEAPEALPVFTFILVKLASRCNIKCTYCYWFRDAEVYKKPALLTLDSEDAFCRRLEDHIREFALDQFTVVFHGGEPLLFPKHRFVEFQHKLDAIAQRTGCAIGRGVCTNGMLIDAEWAAILNAHGVDVTVSLDGPPEIHDTYRLDFNGQGTHAEVLRGIAALRAVGIEPGVIMVCNPATDPERIVSYVVEELGIKRFDILPPDATHSDDPPPIGDYFTRLFDVWYDRYAAQGVRIRSLESMVQGLVGDFSVSDTIGLGPIETVTLMSDGTVEPLDVLRIVGDGSTRTDTSVHKDALQDVQNDPRWRAAYDASMQLCDTCRSCEFLDACGGGHLAQRWSPQRQFDNPSVYCESWKQIFTHIWGRISPTLILDYEEAAAAARTQPMPSPHPGPSEGNESRV